LWNLLFNPILQGHFGNDMQSRIVKAGNLDIDRHVLLLNKSFQQSAWAVQIGTTLTRELHIWKYFSPVTVASPTKWDVRIGDWDGL
jgi:hypothetical protein